jgi:hypothetical protein
MGLHDLCRQTLYPDYDYKKVHRETATRAFFSAAASTTCPVSSSGSVFDSAAVVAASCATTPLRQGRQWDTILKQLLVQYPLLPPPLFRDAFFQVRAFLKKHGLTPVAVQVPVFYQVPPFRLGTFIDMVCMTATGVYVLLEHKWGYDVREYTASLLPCRAPLAQWPQSLYIQHQIYLHLAARLFQHTFPHRVLSMHHFVLVSHPTERLRVYSTAATIGIASQWPELLRVFEPWQDSTKRQRRYRKKRHRP